MSWRAGCHGCRRNGWCAGGAAQGLACVATKFETGRECGEREVNDATPTLSAGSKLVAPPTNPIVNATSGRSRLTLTTSSAPFASFDLVQLGILVAGVAAEEGILVRSSLEPLAP